MSSERASFYALSPFKEKEKPFLSEAIPHFSYDMYAQNVNLINLLFLKAYNIPSNNRVLTSRLLYQMRSFRSLLTAYESILPHIATSEPLTDVLKRVLPIESFQIDQETVSVPGHNQEILETIQNRTNADSIVAISPTHATTYALLREAKSMYPTNSIGLVVFDAHFDFYFSEHENFPGEYPPRYPNFSCITEDMHAEVFKRYQERLTRGPSTVQKKNFLAHLLEERVIDSCLIIGPRIESLSLAFNPPRIDSQNKRTHEFFMRWKDAIRFIPLDSCEDDYELSLEIMREIEYMQARQITHVPISLDIDVLQSQRGYTGFEYNAIAPLINLGLSHLDDAFDRFYAMHFFQQNSDVFIEYALEFIDNIMHNLHHVSSNSAIFESGISVRSKSIGGMRVGQIRNALDGVRHAAICNGMEIGIPLQVGRLAGDIVEVSGYDYRGRTGKTVALLAQHLAQLVMQ